MNKLREILAELYRDGCYQGGNESTRDPDSCIPEAEAAIKAYIKDEIIGEDSDEVGVSYDPDGDPTNYEEIRNNLRAEQRKKLG